VARPSPYSPEFREEAVQNNWADAGAGLSETHVAGGRSPRPSSWLTFCGRGQNPHSQGHGMHGGPVPAGADECGGASIGCARQGRESGGSARCGAWASEAGHVWRQVRQGRVMISR
jgi:hypothetical protein